MTIAIIGAGMAGITCARSLAESGREVQLFDKARGPGGRMASRRNPLGTLDHGAQYFTARDPEFCCVVDAWIAAGAVAPWKGRIVRLQPNGELEPDRAHRFVGTPRMSATTRFALGDLPVQTETRINTVVGRAGTWRLTSEDGRSHGPFEAVLVTTPAPQAVPLLAPAPALARAAGEAAMAPCWAALLWLEYDVDPGWAGAFVEGHPVLGWMAREHTKPERGGSPRWSLHASPEWSQAQLEVAPEAVVPQLVAAAEALLGTRLAIQEARAHRWRYARPVTTASGPCLWEPDLQIGAAGDWCAGARVEAAWLSGRALAERLLDQG